MPVTEGRAGLLRVLSILAVLLFALPSHPSRGGSVPDKLVPVIDSISFRVASPYLISYEELAGIVTVRPGYLLTRDAIRESIRRLQRKSLFRELSAYVREEGGRAELLFYLLPLPVVTEIEVTGNKRIAASRILAISRIRRGIPVTGADLSRAQESVRSFLREKGFLEATVSVSALCKVDTGTGKVRIEVREGSPALVKEVRVPGTSFFPRERLEELLGVSPGSRFDFREWEEGVKKLRGAYKREGIPDGAHSGTRGVLRRRERTVPYRPGGGRSPVRGRLGRSAPLPRQQARESVGDLRRGRRTHGRGAGIRTERTSALLLPGAGLPQGVGRYRIERRSPTAAAP